MTDLLLKDSRAAARLFFAAALALLIGAALGLNGWPAQAGLAAVAQGSAKSVFLAFHGYELTLIVLFWGSRPSLKAQMLVLLGWALTTSLLWLVLSGDMQFSWTAQPGTFDFQMLLSVGLALPGLAMLLWRASRASSAVSDREFELRLRWLFVLSFLFMTVPIPALHLTANLHPQTFDLIALNFDRTAGLGFAPSLVGWINDWPALRHLVLLAYGLTPIGFLAVALLHLRGKPNHVASALLAWVVLSACSLVAYHAFPITGPVYVFGTDSFAAALASPTAPPPQLVELRPFPRNGMPSMHFGWLLAASILWWRTSTGRLGRSIIISITTLTAVATIFNGEHYVIDLIVAVPFVLSAIALSTTGLAWSSHARQGVVIAGFLTWLTWVVLLRTQIGAFVASPWLCWALIAATAAVVCKQAHWMARFDREPRSDQQVDAAGLAAAVATAQEVLFRRFGVMFFASGVAALIYQVLFAKQLALVFGSTATATFTVLATFLGGMAVGSLLGGLLAHRSKRPLLLYALIEAGIAAYCIATPALFVLTQQTYVGLATGMAPDAPSLLLLRVLLGAVVLLIPTILMGTTLPLLAHAIGPRFGRIGSRVAWLYFANTAGAAVGALLTAYFVIPALGVHKTTLVAAMMNLLVALGALKMAQGMQGQSAPEQVLAIGALDESGAGNVSGRIRWAALIALGLGGVLSLGLEVVYVHILAIVAGNSVYAFGLMVATFLLGLSAGGETARRILTQSQATPSLALVVSLLCLACSVAIGATFWNGIPDYFGSYANYPAARSFGAREAIRGLVCALVMVPPTLFIGAGYVFAMDIATSSAHRSKTLLLGLGAAANTAGNIVGVLLFGFVLLPLLGGLQSARTIAWAALGLGILVGAMALGRSWRRAALPTGTALVVMVSTAGVNLDYASVGSGANVYFHPQRWGEVIAHSESIDGGLTMVARNPGPNVKTVHTLLTNGKFQGNDALGGEMQAQIGFALAPLLHQGARESALVIGYGTGVTSRVFHEAGFKVLDIAELSRDIVDLADRYFGKVNAGASKADGVKLNITDGRNLLLLSDRRYDVVSIEITSIWFAGAASLYNREFYALARSRMTGSGVLQQWVQLHHLSPFDILQIIATLRAEFRFVSLYVMGSQGILVATNAADRAEPQQAAIDALASAPGLAEVRRIAGRPAEKLLADRLLGPEGIDRFIKGTTDAPDAWISTDDNLRLEYDTPRANVNDSRASFAANLALLERFR